MAFYDSRVGKLYVAEYDLTSFTTEMELSAQRGMRDVTVLGDSGRKWFPGHSEDKLNWAGLWDDGASGSDKIMDVLRSATTAQVITVWPGDTTVGNRGLGTGQGWQKAPSIASSVGNIVRYNGGELEMGQMDRLRSLGPLATQTATANGTSIDDSSSSSSGGKWIYHITAWSASGGNARWQIVLQDSADDSTFATVGSESVNITAVGAARRTFTGTLRRYVRLRVVLDATSGSLTFIAGYERD